jgi:lysophospholipase L1-like esterase
VPAAMDQVSKYLGDVISKENKADALFIIAIGANDAFFDKKVTAAETTGNIVRMMKRLGDHGECYMFLPPIRRFSFCLLI